MVRWPHLASLLLQRTAADIAPNLLFEPTAVEVTDANWAPAEFSHQCGKVPIATRSPPTLWDLQDVHQRLRADALQAIAVVPRTGSQ
jgi:hypothetical protein